MEFVKRRRKEMNKIITEPTFYIMGRIVTRGKSQP